MLLFHRQKAQNRQLFKLIGHLSHLVSFTFELQMKHIAYIVPYLTSRRTTSVITQAAEALLRPKISSICLTRHDLSRDDQRRPKRTQIAAKFGNRHHHSYNYTSLFYLRPPDQLKRIPSHHSKPDLKAKLKGAPITSLPFSEKCDSIERRTASLVCDCARQLLERKASSSRLKHSALRVRWMPRLCLVVF